VVRFQRNLGVLWDRVSRAATCLALVSSLKVRTMRRCRHYRRWFSLRLLVPLLVEHGVVLAALVAKKPGAVDGRLGDVRPLRFVD
jgi:hypothetical protein